MVVTLRLMVSLSVPATSTLARATPAAFSEPSELSPRCRRASPARSRSGSMAFQGTRASSSVAEMVWPKRP